MIRNYYVVLKKPRCGERGVFVNDIELLILALDNQIEERCELILEPTTVTKCYKAIHSSIDTEITRRCGEEPTCVVEN